MWFRLLLLLSSVFACCGGSKGFFWFHEPSMERVPQWRICCAQACIAPMHRCQQQNFALKKKTLWVFTWWKCLWFWQWELETVNGTRNHRLQRSQKLAACGTKSKGYELSLHKKKGTIGTLCSFVWEGQPNKLRIWTVWWNWKAWNGESTCQSGNERQALGEDVWFQHWSKQTLHGYL